MSTDLLACLAELVEDVDADQGALAAALAGLPGDVPRDPQLRDLHTDLVALRRFRPEASDEDLLQAAAVGHPEAVAQHLAWLDAHRESERPARVLDLTAVVGIAG